MTVAVERAARVRGMNFRKYLILADRHVDNKDRQQE